MILIEPSEVWEQMQESPDKEIYVAVATDDDDWTIVAYNDEITALRGDVPIFSEPVINEYDCEQIVRSYLSRFTDWQGDEQDDKSDDFLCLRDQEIFDAAEGFLTIILEETPDPEICRDVMEHTMTFLARAGYDIRRPMWLQMTDGKFWSEHPYNHI